MYCKVARSINGFVVLLMSLEILGASITALPSTAEYALSICSEDTASGGLGFLMFEKAEEENEKTEELTLSGTIAPGTESRVFDLKNPNAEIKKVVFTYRSQPSVEGDKAHVELYGLK